MPVIAIWEAPPASKAVRVRERAETEEVSAHGALLRLRSSLPEGRRIELRRPGGAIVTRGRVVRNLGLVLDGSDCTLVAVEMDRPGLDFWVQMAL